ncbi:phosphotransferase [Prochlorococcus marinus]|uniref:Aminoglycoside phosphotransferase family protein n=1 Tax=Prochlorococcus marinus XMU1408 TaxID=2213228 RepID=A0A318RG43_PROMR|nr:phosphotransferase [Prochlorococcus marinus]MBW3041670.1 aminoglycoside phosphotransferase family protein [Prochlorococcus marinus str. XMU1408]PYE02823.1 aminoglycoside phosphotransferase family protein [Prochlorococcus marinus XMU1408]
MDLSKLIFITQNFFTNTKVINIDFISSGLINKTYIVEHLYKGIKSKFILQSLSNIFESPEKVTMNHMLITEHLKNKINGGYLKFDQKRWETPNLIRCKSNNLFIFPYQSEFWRAMVYIDKTFCLDVLEDDLMAYQTGIGLAKFHLSCSDLDSSKLKDNIKNFHNTKYYLDQYIMAIKDSMYLDLDNEIKKRVQFLIISISNHLRYIERLLISLNKESIDHNIIHGDPKLSNFLFDVPKKYVVSLIDLDTVSSGYFLTDLADCIRSICNLAGEEPAKNENICFDITSCRYFLKGYRSIMNAKLDSSFKLLPEFIYLLIFELSIRFLTDFLQSNRYFEIRYSTHNLYRAEVQFSLLSSFLDQMPDFLFVLDEIGISPGSTFVSDVQNFA